MRCEKLWKILENFSENHNQQNCEVIHNDVGGDIYDDNNNNIDLHNDIHDGIIIMILKPFLMMMLICIMIMTLIAKISMIKNFYVL